ncbi:MAG: FHA domain-containing protein [Proteobacteria bacterium]|nr:FHA domain-containing protein [Pseudomonadota bacterium]NOG60833.1 FHA domain-containing protein [Pseudomonadota bacterium]
MNKLTTSIFLPLLVFSIPAIAWNTLTNDLDVSCQQIQKKLNCDYRSISNKNVSSIDASSNGLKLETTNNSTYPEAQEKTAILFLVDTSDPARQNVIERNKSHIKEIISSLKPHQKAGLASFDKSLKIQSTIGTSGFLLSKSLETLKASGKTTELYRNLLEAIQQLHTFQAERKVIVLLSDGQAEDKAYFHSDVIKMARKYSIVINTIGYPRSISLSVALQTLRRLSEETGGRYIETETSYNISKSEMNKLFDNIDNGGSFSVALDNLYQAENAVNYITLSFSTEAGLKRIQAPVKIKPEHKDVKNKTESAIAEKIISNNTSSGKAPVQIITKQAAPQPINLWIWYGLPAAFIIIIIFILITLFLLWKKPQQQTGNSKNSYRPYAYLISNDEKQTRYPITRTICRIGRSKDNELHLDDTSISRRHAEIHRNNDGGFEIIDLDSMNGVYINNEKIGKAELHEGDVLEIGDYFLNFTQLAPDYSLEESTVMQKTRMPSTH